MKVSTLLLLSSGWHPRKMFAAADLGTIQVPGFRSVYQESTGSTAGVLGQPCGLIIDERYDYARLAELWADASATFTGSSARVSANVYRLYSTDGTNATVQMAGITTAGKSYEVSFTVDSIATAGSGIRVGEGGAIYTTTGAKLSIFVAEGTAVYIKRVFGATDYQISNVSIKEVPGNHGLQATAGSRPNFAAGFKIDYDGGDDSLVTTWASALGTACTVARSVPNGEASILTGQTITTTYTDSTDHCGLVIINRALTATETNQLRRWLNRRAG